VCASLCASLCVCVLAWLSAWQDTEEAAVNLKSAQNTKYKLQKQKRRKTKTS